MNVRLKGQFLALAASFLLAGAANASPVQTDNSAKLIAQTTAVVTERQPLSTDQLEKLNVLKDKFSLDTAQEKAQLKVDKHELFDLLSKTKVDKQEVLSLNAKMKTLKGEIADARINYLLAASDVLSPEQKEQMHKKFLLRSLHSGNKYGESGRSCGAKGGGRCFGTQAISKRTVNG